MNFSYVPLKKRPEFRRKRDLWEPLLTAMGPMAQALPSPNLNQKSFPGRVHVKFAQHEGHEKITKKAQTLFF